MDTIMRNPVHYWSTTDYDFREEDRPDWLIRVKSGRGTKVKAQFPNCPDNVAAAIDSRAFQSYKTRDTNESYTSRYRFREALPEVIEGLEAAGLGNDAYTNELRKVLYFADMWIMDDPDIMFTRASGGYYHIDINGFKLDMVQ